ncbi:MAG: sugar ABC transporter permease, partial [Deinococcus sp.]|nr:sugar ABC transporter permease [Deinococcus sp.]
MKSFQQLLAGTTRLRGLPRVQRDLKYGLFFVSPAIVYFGAFWILPVLLALFYSFTRWRVGRVTSFVGLRNYLNLFTDPQFHQSLLASAEITILAVAGTCLSALGLAVLLNDPHLWGGRLMKVLIMLPFVTDWVATGLVWQLVFKRYDGMLAGIFLKLGLRDWMALRWTSSQALAPWAIAIFTIWKTTGLYTIIFLAGLKSIPQQYAEAARVD